MSVLTISNLTTLPAPLYESLLATYAEAFAQPPYNESYSGDDAAAKLSSLLKQSGDLLAGVVGGQVVALAGGYLQASGREDPQSPGRREDSVYRIEELAVHPNSQRKRYGRALLQALLALPSAQEAERRELRTTISNERSLALYASEGFVVGPHVEVVPAKRTDGRIGVDRRLYLSSPARSKRPSRTLARVAVMSPSGNTTAVVFDQYLDADRTALQQRISAAWAQKNPDMPIEQCCFVTMPQDPRAVARVEMFGGEFCGNAARSVAWLVTEGEDYTGVIEVSGARELVPFEIRGGAVTVEMPLPFGKAQAMDVAEGTLVRLEGMTHLVRRRSAASLPLPKLGFPKSPTPRELLQSLLDNKRYGLAEGKAAGVVHYDPFNQSAEFCVWVRDVNTKFDEAACGTGTSAIGIAEAFRDEKSVNLPVRQPSGKIITTQARWDGLVTGSSIGGQVHPLYDGSLELTQLSSRVASMSAVPVPVRAPQSAAVQGNARGAAQNNARDKTPGRTS